MSDNVQTVLDFVFDGPPPPRTLIVLAQNGIGNRLRALVSGMVFAADAGRTFVLLWPRTPACGASFPELFQNDYPVLEVPPHFTNMTCFLPLATFDRNRIAQREDKDRHLMVSADYWLAPLNDRRTPKQYVESMERLFTELRPVPAVAAKVTAYYAEHFRPPMIGVHLRRGDFVPDRPKQSQNLNSAMLAVDHFLRSAPEAGIFLCTDDGAIDPRTGQPTVTFGVRAAFQQRYGDRVISFASTSLDRSDPLAVQDALAEMWLLRMTDYFVATQASSFSGMAAFGRSQPRIVCPTATPAEDRAGALVAAAGLGWSVRLAARMHLGQDLPFPLAWRWFVHLREVPIRGWRKRQRQFRRRLRQLHIRLRE